MTTVGPSRATAAGRALSRWVDVTRWPLLAASALFLTAYSWLVLGDANGPVHLVARVVFVAVWVTFIVDAIVRLSLTPRGHRAAYIAAHRTEFLSAVVPMVRPFRLLRSLRRLPWFRGPGGSPVRSRILVYALAYAVMFVYVIALAVLAAERGAAGATIVSFGDAVWWACVTVATVGYGDFAPVTVTGRILAVVLMAGGVAIIGTASATVVSYLGERIAASHHEHDGR